jgi:hypothetical protein
VEVADENRIEDDGHEKHPKAAPKCFVADSDAHRIRVEYSERNGSLELGVELHSAVNPNAVGEQFEYALTLEARFSINCNWFAFVHRMRGEATTPQGSATRRN